MSETRATVSITVNGRAVAATPGEPLIEAVGRAGEYVPRFCYHPRMEPVGVCRMCLVEVEGPRGMTLQPACYVRVNDGMNICTNSDKVKKAQDGILEFLLANHPLDCPVCDKGGECPLQDQALAYGSGETRFVEEKRHFVKPVSIGELVLLDRERCIQCSRCTRFQSEVAGEAEIAFAGRGDLIEVAPSPVEPFDSVFSGNTVQICPVGALTAKPYRFAARPWDLEQVESTCTMCAVGCRVAVQSSQNRLTRVLGVDADGVNHGWLCDKGRFTIDAVDGNAESTDVLSASTRITSPMVRRNGRLEATSWSEALRAAADALRGESTGVIGGATLTNEGAFAWERVARQVLRTENIDAQFDDGFDARLAQALPGATIDDITHACTIVTLTGDLREELPVLHLRVREALTKHQASLVEFTTVPSALTGLAKVAVPIRPGEVAQVAAAILDGSTPSNVAASSDQIASARHFIGTTGEGVVIIVGRANLAEDAGVVEAAVRRLAEALPQAKFMVAFRRANVRGALDMGLAPGLAPGRTGGAAQGRTTRAQLEAMASGEQASVLLLGGCLLGNVWDRALAASALERASVVAVTGHGGQTLAYADVVLPAHVSYERSGTVTNIEGRVSALTPKVVAPGAAWDDVAIAAELAEEFGYHLGLTSIEATTALIETTTGYPTYQALSAGTEGVVIGSHAIATAPVMDPAAFPGIRAVSHLGFAASSTAHDAIEVTSPAMATPLALVNVSAGIDLPSVANDAYATSLVVQRRLYDNGVAMQGSASLHNLRATAEVTVNSLDLDGLGVADGAALTLKGAHGDVAVSVRSDAQLARGVAVIPFGAVESPFGVLADSAALVTTVRMESR